MHAFSFLRLAGLLLAILASFVPFDASAQTSCGPSSVKQVFNGGLFVEKNCNNRFIDGVGTTTQTAQTNLSNFTTLLPAKGCRASESDPIGIFEGGYRVSFHCTNNTGAGYFVSGVGSNATAAGQNAFTFGQLYTAIDDVACSVNNYDITAFVGGYRVDTRCIKSGLPAPAIVSGIGSTATDAGINARGFAELVASGNRCSLMYPLTYSGGMFQATYSCSGQIVYGSGATVTDTGNDALANANLL